MFFFQRQPLHFQLDEAAVDAIHRLRLAVELHADLRGGFVDKVDGFVRQLAVGDVAVGEDGGGDQRGVGDVDAVMHFIALLQAAQDGDGVFHRRLFHHHFLETALQRGVFFHVLAVFVQRRCADAMQLAARQGGFQHIAGVHRAFGFARADHGVNFVNEKDDLAVGFFDVGQHRFQALFKFAAVFGASQEGGKIQREQALAFQAFRHFAIDDALRQAFHDGGFADARLADEDRVVFVAPLQDLHGAADFLVATDDRINFALLGTRGDVNGVFLQRFAFVFGALVGDGFAAAQLVDDLLQLGFLHARRFQRLAERAGIFAGSEQEQLGGDVFVAVLLRVFVAEVQEARGVGRDVYLAGGVCHARQVIDDLLDLRAQGGDVRARLAQDGCRRAAFLPQQGEKDVRRFDVIAVLADGNGLRGLQRFLEARGKGLHGFSSG